jgi:hypothetical protein
LDPIEEKKVIHAFKAGHTLPDITAEHGRTLRAIEATLEKDGSLVLAQTSTSGIFFPHEADDGVREHKRTVRRSRRAREIARKD